MNAVAVSPAAAARHWRRGRARRLARLRVAGHGGETLAMVVGGVVTGTLIGFFWHPAASLAAMLTAAAVAVRPDRPSARPGQRPG